MLARRLPAFALLGALPLMLVNCSSDDPGSRGTTAGTGATAGTGTAGGAGSANGGGAPTAGTTNAGSAGTPSGGSAGATTGGSGGASTGGGGSGAGGSAAGGSGGGSGGTTGDTFKLTSTEIMDGQPIPEEHTCDGGGGQMNWGVAPSFKWENPPVGTMSYAFFMIDWTLTMKASPDVNGYHSGAWNIATTVTSLAEGWGVADLGASAQAINGGYLGPCPPMGTDTYHMIVLALPMTSYTINGTGTAGVKSAYDMLKGVALGTAEVTGTYMRQ